jgi:hypothetical protein
MGKAIWELRGWLLSVVLVFAAGYASGRVATSPEPPWHAMSALGTLLAVLVALGIPIAQTIRDRSAKRLRQASIVHPMLVVLVAKSAWWVDQMRQRYGKGVGLPITNPKDFEYRRMREGSELLNVLTHPEVFGAEIASYLLNAAAWSKILDSDLESEIAAPGGVPFTVSARFFNYGNLQMTADVARNAIRARNAMNREVFGREWDQPEEEKEMLRRAGLSDMVNP